jgi:hypothetical protein
MNRGESCSKCKHEEKVVEENYLHDILNLWSKGNEAVCLAEAGLLQE